MIIHIIEILKLLFWGILCYLAYQLGGWNAAMVVIVVLLGITIMANRNIT